MAKNSLNGEYNTSNNSKRIKKTSIFTHDRLTQLLITVFGFGIIIGCLLAKVIITRFWY